MKVEVWSDYVCPFCYIGKRQLEKAVADSGYGEQIEVEFKSFLLDPTTPVDSQQPVYESLAQKYGSSIDEVKKMTANVTARAAEVGLQYNFDDMKTANTVAAHRLVKWAAKFDKEKALNEALLQAYFLQGKAIGRHDELIALAEQVGLDGNEAAKILASDQFKEDVEQDIYEAQQIGVRGVPFFVFNNKYGISGAQPQALFEQTIEQVAQESGLKRKLTIVGEKGGICEDGTCEI